MDEWMESIALQEPLLDLLCIDLLYSILSLPV